MLYMLTYSARWLLYKHDEMQIDVLTYNQLQQETSKKYVRKFLLPPYVSEALNVWGILILPSCPAACVGYFQDTWWYRTAESLFHCCGRTLQTTGKPATDSFMDPCEGSLQTKANYSLFAHRNE